MRAWGHSNNASANPGVIGVMGVEPGGYPHGDTQIDLKRSGSHMPGSDALTCHTRTRTHILEVYPYLSVTCQCNATRCMFACVF